MMQRFSSRRMPRGLCVLCCLYTLTGGCFGAPQGATDKNDLAAMPKVKVHIPGRTTYTAYVAREDSSGAGRAVQLGLMNVTQEELPDDHGMIFVFRDDRLRNFWMRNTIIPLDIAYIRSDGIIVKTYTMQPLSEAGYPSIEPARFVLEVNAGQFARWQIQSGDRVELPAELFD